MHSTLLPLLNLLLLAPFIHASPLKRQTNPTIAQDFDPPPGGDVTILNYALTLEYLERTFYAEGLANYTHEDFIAAGFPDPFYCNLKEIYEDEKTHVTFLTNALLSIDAAPVSQAIYLFPSTTAKSFIALASLLETVGVSAYAGAASAIINKAYLSVAGTILPVEARHSSYIRAALGEKPFPRAFDTPLDFNAVHTLATQFIVSFPEDSPPLPFKAFPGLVVKPQMEAYGVGSPVIFTGAWKNAIASGLVQEGQEIYAVLFSGLDKFYVLACREGDDLRIVIPGGDEQNLVMEPSGQVYVVLSTADGGETQVVDGNTVTGVGVLEVGEVGGC